MVPDRDMAGCFRKYLPIGQWHHLSCVFFRSNQLAAWYIGLRCGLQAPNRPEKKNKKSKFYQAIRNQNQFFYGFNPESTTETSGLNIPLDFERPKLRILQKSYEITPEVPVERKPEKFSKFQAKKNYGEISS
jgi:hypothetical protein